MSSAFDGGASAVDASVRAGLIGLSYLRPPNMLRCSLRCSYLCLVRRKELFIIYEYGVELVAPK